MQETYVFKINRNPVKFPSDSKKNIKYTHEIFYRHSQS